MNRRVVRLTIFASLLTTALLCHLDAHGQPPAGDLGTLFTSIKAQEANFPLPSTSETILVGTVNLSVLQHAFPGGSPGMTCLNNNYDADDVFTYAVPTYTNGTSSATGCGHLPHGWQWPTVQSVGAQVTVANVRHLNLRFDVTGTAPSWASAANGGKVVFQLGTDPQQIVPALAGQSVTFNDVTATSLPLTITVHWIDPRYTPSQVGGVGTAGVGIVGVLPVQVSWNTVGAGAVTIPALPVAIVYAPPVDAQKKNQATSTTSRTLGNTSTVSFTTSNSTTVPVPSQFQTTTDISKGMSALGQVLSKIPNPIVQGVGAALSTISSLLGSSSAAQTASQAATSQHSLAVVDTSALSLTTSANDGGPGAGDIIAYFYNARVLWYSVNGTMTLALLGYDGFASPSAQRLQNALSILNGQPPGTLDPNWHIDAATITQLLKLDPFVAGGASVQLPLPRFAESQNGVVDPGAGEMTYVAQSTVTATELTSTTTSTLNMESDSAGMLSFLGIGVTTSQTLQSEISQSSSNQITSGQSVTQSYNFYNNGSEHYECEVYLDAIFGTFAFRDVTTNALPALSGKLVDQQGNAIANSSISLNVGNRTFVTNTDSIGNFALHLAGITSGSITVNTAKGDTQLKYQGTPLRNLILRIQ